MKVVLVNLCISDYTVALANALAQHVDLTLVQPARQALPWQSQIDPKVRLLVREIPKKRDPRSLIAVSELLQFLCELRPDILHLQDPVNPWFDLVASLRRLPPTVVTVHDATRHPGENGAEWFSGMLRNRLLLRSQAVIVHAATQRDLLCARWRIPRNRVHLTPHGELGSLYRRAGGPGTDGVRRTPESVLFFGRIVRYKGLGVLIAAMEMVRREIPDARLLIAGSGEPMARYLSPGGDRTWVEIMDRFIPHAEVAGLFGRAGMVALPYLEASQSGVASIAFGLGTPVIASAIGGLAELITDGVDGVLVPPGDPAALARAIVDLMRDENRRHRLSAAAQLRCQRDLAWSTIAKQTVGVYQRILCSKTDTDRVKAMAGQRAQRDNE